MVIEALAVLLAATLFGGMALYSFGFAPFVFSALPAEQAGGLIRRAFPWYYLFVVGGALAAAVPFWALDRPAAAALAATAASGLYARQVLMPAINAARDAGASRRFARLHGVSVAINFAQLAAIGWALARLVV